MGISKIDLTQYQYSISYLDKQIFYDDSNKLFVVDVVNNKLKIYYQNNNQTDLILPLESVFLGGKFYCFYYIPATHKAYLNVVTEDKFFGELVKEEPFYYNNEKIYYTLSILFLTGMIIFSFFNIRKWNRKRNRIVLKENVLIYKSKTIPFDEKLIKILNLLLYSPDEVDFSELIDIVDNKDLNYAHKTRVVNGLIDEINFKLKSLIDVNNDIITFKKSKLDRRIKVYTINKDFFY